MAATYSVARTIFSPDPQTDAAMQELCDHILSQFFAHGDGPPASDLPGVRYTDETNAQDYVKINGTWTLVV